MIQGGQDRIIPGNAATIQPDKPFKGLASFGSQFLSKFQISETSSSILESIILIDTPGVLAGDKQRLGRAYDYPSVIKWFAEHSDLILVFFDAHKLDVSDELKELLNVLESHDDKIRIVLNKADQVEEQELLRVYGALMWSLGKVIQTPEVPRVYISTFRQDVVYPSRSQMLLEAEKKDLLDEIKQLPMNSTTRKINEIVKRTRLLRAHTLLINHLRTQLPSLWGKSSKQAKLIDNLPSIFTFIKQKFSIPVGDFPNLDDFASKLRSIDLSVFPKLSTKNLVTIGQVLTKDIPELMMTFPLAFSQLRLLREKNPFSSISLSSIDVLGESMWELESVDFERYTSIFNSLKPTNEKLGGKQCREYLMQSGLPETEMAKLWALADQDRDGQLSRFEFGIMMHLIHARLLKINVPEHLPLTLFPPQHG